MIVNRLLTRYILIADSYSLKLNVSRRNFDALTTFNFRHTRVFYSRLQYFIFVISLEFVAKFTLHFKGILIISKIKKALYRQHLKSLIINSDSFFFFFFSGREVTLTHLYHATQLAGFFAYDILIL